MKSFLYAILEAEAVNAAEINELRKAQEAVAEELREMKKNQEKMLKYLKGNSHVREASSFSYHFSP
ncbi:MAG TPA: hypothetical protein VF199_05135 [Bacillales bacterium]